MNELDALSRLQAIALAAGAPPLATEAGALAERVREMRFHLACVGQFKRGKSTLVNALIGQPVLPTGVVPVTSVPTVLRHGQLGARVLLADGWRPISVREIGEYVTEQRNPGNARGVRAVEIFVSAPVLEHGLCLVDTPGLGSVHEINSAATRAFLPHMDAALVVLGADPPISGEELRLVEAVAEQVDRMVFVLNKVDRVTESDAVEAADFIRQVVTERLGRPLPEPIYRVSAISGAEPGGGGPDWEALSRRLQDLARVGREALVRGAVRRGLGRLGEMLIGILREQVSALARPLEESERRVAVLGELGRATERTLRDLRPLFAAEEQRLTEEFTARAQDFLGEARASGMAILAADWEAGRFDRASRPEALEHANRLARGLVYGWLPRAEAEAEAAYEASVRRFSGIAGDQLRRLEEAAGVDRSSVPPVTPGGEGLRLARHFSFTDRMTFHYPWYPWAMVIDAVVPAVMRRRRRRSAAEVYLDDLLEVNASRVAGDLAERVRESRRDVEAEICRALGGIAATAQEALNWARAIRARGAAELQAELERLGALVNEVEELLQPVRDQAA
jgi:hypothetical protein